MPKELYISSSPHETKVAVWEDDQLVEVFFERDTGQGLVGNIYKGRVSRVLPGMQSAFVDVGLERDAFLYVSDFFEDSEEYDKVVSEAEAKVTRYGQGTPEVPAAAPPLGASIPPVDTVVVPAIAETPQPPVTREPVVAPPTPASAVASPPADAPVATLGQSPTPTTSAPSSQPPSQRNDYAAGDHRGRRRRRRGRGFREDRLPARPDRPDRPTRPDRPERVEPPPLAAAEPHDFQILPGESLAKYAQGSGEQPDIAAVDLPGEGVALAGEFEAGIETAETGVSSVEEEAESLDAAVLSAEKSGPPATTVFAERYGEPEPAGEEAVGEEPTPKEVAEPARIAFAELQPQVAVEVSTTSPAAVVKSMSLQDTLLTTSEASAPLPPFNLEVVVSESRPVEPVAPVQEEIEQRPESLSATQALGELDAKSNDGASAEAEPVRSILMEETVVSTGEDRILAVNEVDGQERDEIPENGEEEASEATELEPADAGVEESAAEAETLSGEAPPSGERSYTLRDSQQPRPRFAPRRRRGGGRRGPGGDVRRAEASRPGNNQPVQIAELLKEGQEILVQIAKEPLGTKGARITSHIALPGRYLVYMPTIHHIGVSRKISSEEERLRLRNIILENRGNLAGGFIVRTAGQGRPEEELKADLKFLSTLWNDIRAKAERTRAPALMHRDLDLVQRVLRDTLSPDFKTIRVDSEVEYERVLEFVSRCQPTLVGHVKLYDRETPLFEEFGVEAEIDKALKPKVWLKSGGFIVINQTEALVAIDVNTGKFVGKTNRLEDTIVKTNIDAVREIVRQIRLRDLGGIIVIDFIDMDERRNRQKVVQALEEALRHDRAPTNILSINEFGLVALTRKRVKQSLERTLCEPCNYCSGSGWIKSVATVCYQIVEEARKMARHIEGKSMTLRVNPEVAQALKSREGALLAELEALSLKDVIIKSDPTVHQERFEIF